MGTRPQKLAEDGEVGEAARIPHFPEEAKDLKLGVLIKMKGKGF